MLTYYMIVEMNEELIKVLHIESHHVYTQYKHKDEESKNIDRARFTIYRIIFVH